MPGNFGSTTFIVAFCCEPWMRNSPPIMAMYGSMPWLRNESVAAWMPTKPLPAAIAASNFFLPWGDIGSPG